MDDAPGGAGPSPRPTLPARHATQPGVAAPGDHAPAHAQARDGRAPRGRGRTVHGADGRTWVVRRRWVPRLGVDEAWRRLRGRSKRSTDGARTAVDVSLVAGAFVIEDAAVILRWLVIAVVTVVLLFASTFLLVVELVLLALLLLAGVGSRVLLRRPWTIEAVADTGERLRWKVTGWRASTVRRDEIAELLAAGTRPPPDA